MNHWLFIANKVFYKYEQENMIDKIKELRKIIPIPIGEASQLLKDNGRDIETCIYKFKEKSLKEIQQITGCDETMASEHYEREKYDFNRTVSSIRETLFDENYTPIESLTKEGISAALQWIRIVDSDSFGVAIEYDIINTASTTMLLIPALHETALLIKEAKEARDKIFEGYKETDLLEEFVRRSKLLDDNKEFAKANQTISLKTTILKEELLRHFRNL